MIFKAFSKTFPTKTKPCKFPERKEKKRGGGGSREKQKERVEKKAKGASQDCCVTFKLQKYLKILLSILYKTRTHVLIMHIVIHKQAHNNMLWSISDLFQRENLMECLVIW